MPLVSLTEADQLALPPPTSSSMPEVLLRTPGAVFSVYSERQRNGKPQARWCAVLGWRFCVWKPKNTPLVPLTADDQLYPSLLTPHNAPSP